MRLTASSAIGEALPPLGARVGPLLPDKPLMQALEHDRVLRTQNWVRFAKSVFLFYTNKFAPPVKKKSEFSPALRIIGLFQT
jgi:hypothetical protein